MDKAQTLAAISKDIQEDFTLSKDIAKIQNKAIKALKSGNFIDAENALYTAKSSVLMSKNSSLEKDNKQLAASLLNRCAKIANLQGSKSDYERAASYYLEAYQLLEEINTDAEEEMYNKYIWELLRLFDNFSDPVAIQTAIHSLEEHLKRLNPYKERNAWGTLQMFLGTAYSMLGAARANSEYTAKAIEHFQRALSIVDQSTLPHLWGTLQNNLGIALLALWEHSADISKLHTAVDSFESALSVYDQLDLKDRAGVHSNLGNAFLALGKISGSIDYYHRAILAYRAAIKHTSLNDSPKNYFLVRVCLGEAIRHIGEQKGSKLWLKKAIRFLTIAAGNVDRERYPILWSNVQNNLGIAQYTIGDIDNNLEIIKKSYYLLSTAAIPELQRTSPLQWLMLQYSRANSALAIGELEKSEEFIQVAIDIYEEGIQHHKQLLSKSSWGKFHGSLGCAYRYLFNACGTPEHLIKSLTHISETFKIYNKENTPLEWAYSCDSMGLSLLQLALIKKDLATLSNSVSYFKAALSVYTPTLTAVAWESSQNNLASALMYFSGASARKDILEEAINGYRLLLRTLKTDSMRTNQLGIEHNLAYCLLTLGRSTCDITLLQEAEQKFISILNRLDTQNTLLRERARINLEDVQTELLRLSSSKKKDS